MFQVFLLVVVTTGYDHLIFVTCHNKRSGIIDRTGSESRLVCGVYLPSNVLCRFDSSTLIALPSIGGSRQCLELQRAAGKLQVLVYSNVSGWGGASGCC